MSGLIEPLIRVFETLIQGMLTLVVLAYVVSTQRRWQWHLLGFGRRFAGTAKESLHLNDTELGLAYAITGIGIIYYFGLLTNLVSFGLLRPAHEAVIHDVYQAIQFQVDLGDSSRGLDPPLGAPEQQVSLGSREPLRNWPDETSIAGLSVATVTGLWGQLGRLRHVRNPGGVGPLYYSCYMEDEAAWRNSNSEAATNILDPLLKQARVARGTTVAALMMSVWAGAKVAIALVCFAVLILGERYRFRRGGALISRICTWCDRRFVRTDEREVGPEGGALPPRELPEARRDANRLLWTNLVVGLAAYAAFMVGLGAYKMVEREYHLMACYGARASMRAGAPQGLPVPSMVEGTPEQALAKPDGEGGAPGEVADPSRDAGTGNKKTRSE